ncbi:hypothetical protein [Alloyangia pacifica]|uniref:Uncharacterized protein n=1 Tax=Alloyangia pacifica TaxID=311180 RepID=A0A1I6QIX0_9RHOB|nr:hypothetical protein [Alloyangia pacifica]SDF90666.1 hypothetical protein SAMN04488245_10197 [Alloyangia pacifica]SFS52260.1 hypothetical protein SAMN04488050_10298 [Alloyangia pacifica]
MTDTSHTSPDDILAKIRAKRSEHEHRKSAALTPLPPQREYEGQGLSDRLWEDCHDEERWLPEGFWFAFLVLAILATGGALAIWLGLDLLAAAIRSLAMLIEGML